MAQYFGQENLPPVVKASSTSLTLASSYLGQSTVARIGGQAYQVSSTLTLNTGVNGANGLDTGSFTQNTLYYCYLVLSNNLPALIISVTGPATGPTGFTSAYKYLANFRTLSGSAAIADVNTILTGADYKWPELNEGPTLPTAMSDSQATALGLKVYSHGATYNGGNAPTLSGSGFVAATSSFIPYQMQNGSWRIKFNFNGNGTSSTFHSIAIAGITFDQNQAIVGTAGTLGVTPISPMANIGTGQVAMGLTGARPDSFWSGDVSISSKPTWAY